MDQSNTIYVYPTDTVWGIGCSIYNQDGFEKIAKIKKTKADKPLSILFESRAEIELFFNLEFIKDINLFFKFVFGSFGQLAVLLFGFGAILVGRLV